MFQDKRMVFTGVAAFFGLLSMWLVMLQQIPWDLRVIIFIVMVISYLAFAVSFLRLLGRA
ncbi:MAG: hypothetical protein ACUVV0_06500 [Anaerolineae bacterium]